MDLVFHLGADLCESVLMGPLVGKQTFRLHNIGSRYDITTNLTAAVQTMKLIMLTWEICYVF